MDKNKIKIKKWDLSILANHLTLPELLELWKQTSIAEMKRREKSIKSLSEFKKWYFLYQKETALETKVEVICEEISNQEYKSDEDKDILNEKRRISNELDAYAKKIIYVYWLFIDNKEKITEYFKDPELKPYKIKQFDEIFGNGKHILTKEENKRLWINANMYKELDRIRDATEEAIVPDRVVDENGISPDTRLTYNHALSCSNPALRKSAWCAWARPQYDNRKVWATIINAGTRARQVEAELLKYNSYFDYFMDNNYGLARDDFQFVLRETSKFAKPTGRYNSYNENLIKTAYGLENYNVWDHKIVIQNTNDNISSTEAKEDLHKGLSVLGQEYEKYLSEFLASKKINWDNKCKGSAYAVSSWLFEEGGMINFNWDGTSNSISTLGHELGHTIASKFRSDNNNTVATPKNTLDETSSIVNSVLMSLYYIDKMKNNNSPKEHLYGIYKSFLGYLTANISETAVNYIFIDTALCDIEKDEDYTFDKFEENFLKWKVQYHGVTQSWAKKIANNTPHKFYLNKPYYLMMDFVINPNKFDKSFAYSIGSILGLYIGYNIYNGNKELLNKYIKFLKVGNQTNPIKVVKDTLGINLLKPEIYTASKKILSKLISQFEKDIKI